MTGDGRRLTGVTFAALTAGILLGLALQAGRAGSQAAVRWRVEPEAGNVDCFTMTDATWGSPRFEICMDYGPRWTRLGNEVTPTRTPANSPTVTATATAGPTATVTPTATATPESGQVAGRVYLDENGNGTLDESERAGIGGVQVTVRAGYGIMYVRTCCTNGEYAVRVAPGSYTVTYTLPDGYTATGPTSRTVTVGAGEAGAADFGIRK